MGPFKCPECGIWWAGFEHRCRQPVAVPSTTPTIAPTPWRVQEYLVCTCPSMPPNYVGDWFCPLHNVQITSSTTGTWWVS